MLQYTKGWKSFRLQGLYTGSLPVYKFTSQTCTVFVLLQTVECSKMIQTFLLLSFCYHFFQRSGAGKLFRNGSLIFVPVSRVGSWSVKLKDTQQMVLVWNRHMNDHKDSTRHNNYVQLPISTIPMTCSFEINRSKPNPLLQEQKIIKFRCFGGSIVWVLPNYCDRTFFATSHLLLKMLAEADQLVYSPRRTELWSFWMQRSWVLKIKRFEWSWHTWWMPCKPWCK